MLVRGGRITINKYLVNIGIIGLQLRRKGRILAAERIAIGIYKVVEIDYLIVVSIRRDYPVAGRYIDTVVIIINLTSATIITRRINSGISNCTSSGFYISCTIMACRTLFDGNRSLNLDIVRSCTPVTGVLCAVRGGVGLL